MFFEVNDREPIYIQIIRHIKTAIVTGTLQAGDEIPSRRELAESLRVNPNTVQRAYREMEGIGLIETVRNFPSKITNNKEILKAIRSELVDESINKFLESMKSLNFSKEEVIDIINEKY